MTAPSILTPSLLSSIRTRSTLPPQTWYFIAGVTLSALNRPDEIPSVFAHALAHTPNTTSHLQLARRMREGLVKSAAVIGLPKTINSLLALKSGTPTALLDEPMGYSASARPVEMYGTPSAKILLRGQHFFDRVYGKVAKRVMGQMDRCGTEDLGLTARLMYGYLLSNSNVLTPMESSCVLLAGLIPQDVNPQLKGHLKGALNNGATIEEVRAVRDVCIEICEASGMRRLDENAAHAWGWREAVANL